MLQKDPEQRLCKNVAGHALLVTQLGVKERPGPYTIEGTQEAPPFQPGNSLNVEDPDEIGTFPDLPTSSSIQACSRASWLYVSATGQA